jgi:methionyl-tRNA formyltransferase
MDEQMDPIRIVFMGTPEFAVPSLVALHDAAPAQGWELVGVATQPDRPAGRGNKVIATPVKVQAEQFGLPILQPAGFRKDPDALPALAELQPDLLVVAAYGLILPRTVLALPRYGAINVHASLLPAYRGASPITTAILDGRETTGISIMLVDAGMDTGPVLAQVEEAIHADDTTASLSERLAVQGAALLVETVPRWLAGEITPVAQDQLPGEASLCRLIKKEDGQINWSQPAAAIERMTRAYTPWPSAYTTWHGEPFKIWRASVLDGRAEAGRVVATPQGTAVGTGVGLLLLHSVQPAGKRILDIRSFLNGAPDFVGTRLGA